MNEKRNAPAAHLTLKSADEIRRFDVLAQAKSRHGLGGAKVQAIALLNSAGLPMLDFAVGEKIGVHLLLRAEQAIAEPAVGVQLHDRRSNLIFAAGTRQLGTGLPPLAAGDEIALCFVLTLDVTPGLFTLTVDCSEPSAEGPNLGVFHDVVGGLGPLTVHLSHSQMWPFYGVARLPLEVTFANTRSDDPVSGAAS